MKKLLIWGVIALITVFTVPAVVHSDPVGPPEGLDVNVVNLPLVQDIRDVDHPALQPFSGGDFGIFQAGEVFIDLTITVPAGKRLVVEHVSIIARADANERYVALLTATSNNISAGHFIDPPVFRAVIVNTESYTTSEQIKLYADPETDVVLRLLREDDSDGGDNADFLITGYLIDLE